MQDASEMATCGSSCDTAGPRSFSESTIGRINDEEDAASSTALSAPLRLLNSSAIPMPSGAAITPAATARRLPGRIPRRSAGSRTGTREPATNMTSAKPMVAIKVKIGSCECNQSNPLTPRTIPASNSPSTTGSPQPPPSRIAGTVGDRSRWPAR